ncbi:MAG: DUF3603 family protein [Bacilli bacterium]|jgi:uncharacterized protein YukJ|nr:DUF3603 family protein [Bacilli bacterium]
MIYIYDILLNLRQMDEGLEFYEWKEDDLIEHIKKVPLFKVSKTLIEDLFTNKLQLDITILPKIRNKAICYFNGETKQIPYLVLLSDGRKCFAIELDNKGNTLYKSSLLLDEEEEVLEMTEELVELPIGYKKTKIKNNKDQLTRFEKDNQKFLLRELEKIKDNKEEINYLYEEYFDNNLTSIDDKFNTLKDNVYIGSNNYIKELKSFFLINKNV